MLWESNRARHCRGRTLIKKFPLEAGNLTHPLDLEVFKLNVKMADAQNKMFASLCQERSGGTMKYVSTATVVRDLVALHDALEGDVKPIDYWGFSYGTIVGSYLVNMSVSQFLRTNYQSRRKRTSRFPDRVGRIIIDGVVGLSPFAFGCSLFQLSPPSRIRKFGQISALSLWTKGNLRISTYY